MLLPLEYNGEAKILKINNHEQYCMVWEYFKTQYLRKKAGKGRRKGWMFGWQIAQGDIPLSRNHENVGFIT